MNKMKEILVIGITALLVCGAGIGMVGGNTEDTGITADGLEFTADGLRDLLRKYIVTEDRITVSGIEYTMDELLDLYRKYNIAENDIKFAMSELPHFLEGTILHDSNIRVIATETGEPPEGMKEGVDYDIVISEKEMFAIEEEAIKRYIEKYEVNPGNTKIDVAKGIPFPAEEVKRLLKSGEISGEDLADAEPLMTPGTLGGPSNGPHAIDGKIYVHIFEAMDEAHAPTEPYKDATNESLNRFETEFGVDMIRVWHPYQWDASDVEVATNSEQVLIDLEEDTRWVIDENHPDDIVLGWAHYLDHNGLARPDWFHAVCSDTRVGIGDWPHDSIVQHETSHLFDAPDHDSTPPECIMDYWNAYWGTDVWCDSCRETVRLNIREPPAQGEDIGIFKNGVWYVDTTGNHNADQVFCYGFAGTTPLVGDINQDGTDDIAIVKAYGGNYRWFVDTNGDHVADEEFWFGFEGAIPLVGDFDQDGTDDIAIVGAYSGNYRWFVDTNGDHVADEDFWFGFAGAIPLVGDIDQDGTDDIAIVGAYGGNNRWFVDTNGNHVVDEDFWFGFAGATPLVGDIDRDGTDDIAIVKAYGGNYMWFVDTNFDKTADQVFWFGFAGATPLVGYIG